MRRIPLTKGKEALVDDADYEYLMQWKWYPVNSGSGHKLYACRNRRMVNYTYERGTCKMHKVEARRMGLPYCRVDHWNGDGLDNRRRNLRPATNSLNLANRGPQANNTSGYKGVTWDRERQKWMAQIAIQGRHIFLGRFDDKCEAAQAYNEAASKHFGAFAVLNPV